MKKFAIVLLVILVAVILYAKPKLEVWGRATFVPEQNTWMTNKVNDWAEANDVEVNFLLVPVEQFNSKMSAALQTGNLPDVVIHGWPVAQPAEEGLLLPLDDVVDKLGRDDFFPFKLNEDRVDGKVYGIPTFYEPYLYHIRIDLFEEAGIEIPTNYAELAEAAVKLSDPSREFYGLGFSLGRSMDSNNHFIDVLINHNGGYLAENNEIVFNSVATYESYAWIKYLYDNEAIPTRGMIDIGNNNAYINENIAMTSNPPSIYYSLKRSKPELAEVTKLYSIGETTDGGEESCFVFSTTEYPELSKDLIYTFFADKEDYRVNFIESSECYGLPIFISQAEIISEQWKNGQWEGFGQDPMEIILSIKHVSNPTAFPLNEATSISDTAQMTFIWADSVTDLLFNNRNITDIVKDVVNKLEELKE
ncbi:MAG: multiple sugar transport system substrate-binding protein [Kosmotogales bacterium]|nr:multiple sugar transport system substrate-binding protein [Kosmotogales bacterium]